MDKMTPSDTWSKETGGFWASRTTKEAYLLPQGPQTGLFRIQILRALELHGRRLEFWHLGILGPHNCRICAF